MQRWPFTTRTPIDISHGLAPGFSVVHQYGENNNVGTSYTPISVGGIFRTPQIAAALPLRIKAGG